MLKRVYVSLDEFTAITLKTMLEGKGIKAMVRRFETTWLNGLPKFMEGGWGEILVPEDDKELAERYIQEFLKDSNQD